MHELKPYILPYVDNYLSVLCATGLGGWAGKGLKARGYSKHISGK